MTGGTFKKLAPDGQSYRTNQPASARVLARPDLGCLL